MADTGTLRRDNNNIDIQVASDMEAFDGAGTPNRSPLAYNGSAGAVITLTRPANGKEMAFRPSTNMRLSTTQADLTQDYVVFDGESWFVIPVGRATSVFIRSDVVGGGTIQFFFLTV